jgi:AcrR family transcriptional regulator
MQTRERLMGAAVAEFKRLGMQDADVSAIAAAAGVAHGTFFFHFPTKAHVLLELERREEQRIARQLDRYLQTQPGLAAALEETVRLVLGLKRRLGPILLRDFLGMVSSRTRLHGEGGEDHPVIVAVAKQIASAQERAEADADLDPLHNAVFFLLGLYALLTATHDWPTQREMIDEYLVRTLRSLGVR